MFLELLYFVRNGSLRDTQTLCDVNSRKPCVMCKFFENFIIIIAMLHGCARSECDMAFMKILAKKIIFRIKFVRTEKRIGIFDKSFSEFLFNFDNNLLDIIN